MEGVPKTINDKLAEIKNKSNQNRIKRFVLSALSSIPWVGGVLSASAAYQAEKEQGKINELHELTKKMKN